MNTQEPSRYLQYEQQKALILNQNLSPEEFVKKMKALAKKLGV